MKVNTIDGDRILHVKEAYYPSLLKKVSRHVFGVISNATINFKNIKNAKFLAWKSFAFKKKVNNKKLPHRFHVRCH